MKAFFVVALFALLAVVAISAAPTDELDEYNRFTAFLKCMGHEWAHHCGGATLKCAVARNVKGCISAIVCGGKSTHSCSHHV